MAQTIPTGWEEKTLGEICVIIAGQSPNSQFYNTEANGLPFYQGKKEFTNKYIGTPSVWTTETTKEALPGDILMSVRAPVGPINYATERCCIGRGLASIRNGELISKDFLFYYLLSIQQKIGGHNGAVFNSISRNEISALKILLPSLSEQERIVAKLDKAFEAIDKVKANAEQNLNNAKELFESALNRFFTENTEGWEEKTLKEVCKKISAGGDKPENFSKEITENCKVPTYSNGIENDGLYGYTDVPAITDEAITISARGTIGFICKRIKPYYPIVRLISAIPNDHINIDFMAYALKFMVPTGNGSSIPQLTVPMLKDKKIKYPSLPEQQKIVEKLDALQEQTKRLEQIYTQKIKECDELKQSILQKAFRGEL